jgi:tetrahydromethanopterin S-methyltransferase subunit B
MYDIKPIERLFSEIIESQALTEKEINEINKLIERLKELESSNSDYLNSVSQLYDITNKLLLNLQSVNQNFAKNVENLDRSISNSIDKINTTQIALKIQNELYNLEKVLKNEIDKINDDLKKNVKNLQNNTDELYSANDDLRKTIGNLNDTKRNLDAQISGFNKKFAFFAFLSGLIGGVIICIGLLYALHLNGGFIKITKKSFEGNKYVSEIKKGIVVQNVSDKAYKCLDDKCNHFLIPYTAFSSKK